MPVVPLVYLFSEKRRANLLQRLGFATGFEKKINNTPRIWVHALSVGEVRSALPFVQALIKQKPHAQIIFTASTKTGFETAQQLFGSGQDSLVSLGYFPFDFYLSISRVYGIIEPDLVCLIETDYWPGFLHYMKQQRVPVLLINARLSKKSFKGYLRMGRFSSLFFSSLSHVMAQTPLDARRFKAVGVPERCLSVMGNIKFDQPIANLDESGLLKLKARFGIQEKELVWIAGSTHEGEEKILLDVFAAVKKTIPNLKLILAPRDPKRGDKLMGQVPSLYHSPVLFSGLGGASVSSGESVSSGALGATGASGAENHDLIILDQMGMLAHAYAICDIAFVGGSLLPFGGHNPLEPAMFGKPVLFGPHMTDFLEIAKLLVDARGAVGVETPSQIQANLEEILGSSDRSEQMGAACYNVFFENSGAVTRTIQKMEALSFV